MRPDVLIEVSNEIARKIGGIYTVIRSKSAQLKKIFGENLYMLGVFDPKMSAREFVEENPPDEFKKPITELKKQGVTVHFGRWVEADNTKVFLVDATNFGNREVEISYNEKKNDTMLNHIKHILWEKYKIDSLFMGWDFNENVLWAWAAGMLIEKLAGLDVFRGKRVLAQFHEWISGAGLLYLKHSKTKVATVFTTHATALGRSMMLQGKEDLVKEIREGLEKKKSVDVHKAYEYKIEGKHMLETTCARHADAFTTVSQTMSKEAEYVLGKKPDVITINALDFGKFASKQEIREQRKDNYDDIENFLLARFLPYYKLEISNKLLFYLSGRYEIKNKGVDIYIKALAKLNNLLKKTKSEKTVFAFVFVPTAVTGPKKHITNNLLILNKIDDTLEEELGKAKKELVKKIPDTGAKIGVGVKRKLELLYKSMEKKGKNPGLSVYNLSYAEDAVVKMAKEHGLENREGDKVKIIFYPTYLKPGDGILNMSYTDVITTMDIGVFPSRYEPWGYTPVEAGAHLNVAVTSDLAGFGKFIQKTVKQDERGIKVLHMEGKKEEEMVEELAGMLKTLTEKTKKELEEMKEDAYEIVKTCDWEKQIKNYIEAYELATSRVYASS